MTSVFCTSTRTPTDGSTADSASTASTAWKKVPPAPPCASGISMPITPELEQPVDEAARHLGLIVHFADQRPDFPRRKLPDAVPEQGFVLGQAGQRRRTSGFFHGAGMLSFEGHDQGASSPRLLRCWPPCLRRRCALGVNAQDAPAPQPAAAAAAPPSRPRLRSSAADINFVRVDVIVNDRQGNPVHDLQAGRLRSHRGREAAVDPDVQADQRERGRRRRHRSAARSAQRHRRADGGGARRRAAVRDFSGRLPRAAREQHARARGARAVRRKPVATRRTWRASCIRCGRSTT